MKILPMNLLIFVLGSILATQNDQDSNEKKSEVPTTLAPPNENLDTKTSGNPAEKSSGCCSGCFSPRPPRRSRSRSRKSDKKK